jgi:hypothetical protein
LLANAELYVDVAAGGARVRASLVRPLHQLEGVRSADPRRFEVERGRESDTAGTERPDPDASGDARAAQV